MPELLPISAIIPTRHRAEPLRRTLEAVARQSARPREILVNDRSDDDLTRQVCETVSAGPDTAIRWMRAGTSGAAAQRNEACARATEPFILFMDDDIVPEPDCLARLWSAMEGDPKLGGVSSMITNQSYRAPGGFGRVLHRLLGAEPSVSSAGRWLGSVLNLLPEDSTALPEVVPVEWLNTTCTLYRREALPEGPFGTWFHGYSLGEDLALSLEVKRRGWKLANARMARIYHDTQPGEHKRSEAELATMDVVNRWRIGREYSALSPARLGFNLAATQFFKILALLANPKSWGALLPVLGGNLRGAWQVLAHRDNF